MLDQTDITSAWLARRFAEELGRICSFPLSTYDAIKRALVNLGRELKLEVYPDTAPDDKRKPHREFLWDSSWWDESSDRCELILTAESEWQKIGDVCFDFDKLLVAKAPWKLLVTDAGQNGKSLQHFQDRIERQLGRHVDFRTSETYVWIDHEGHPTGGTLRAFEFKPWSDGKLNTPRFRKIDGSPFLFNFREQKSSATFGAQ